ncbi:MAG: 4Fe-4S binding protein [Candidatus Omnitrophota bacterium]
MANKDAATYIVSIIEPFATFFKLYGVFLSWAWLILMLLASAFISRFYCRYVCPLGAFFVWLTIAVSRIRLKNFSIQLPEHNCKGCRAAQDNCQTQVIVYNKKLEKPEVDGKECLMCNACKEACPIEKAKNKSE